MATKVNFKNKSYVVLKNKYGGNDRTALILSISGNYDEDSIVASVNLPEIPLPEDHVFIKTWGYNEGILEALEESEIVESTGIEIPTGFVTATMVKLLV